MLYSFLLFFCILYQNFFVATEAVDFIPEFPGDIEKLDALKDNSGYGICDRA